MSSDEVQEGWPARRWWVLVGLVFTAQLCLIYWLGRPQHSRIPRQDSSPVLQLASDNVSELLAFNDPTLFALPHQQGFSGSAWLTMTEPDFHPFRWEEPPLVLALNQASLGENFRNYMATNQPADVAEFGQPELKFKLPSVEPSSPLTTHSALSLIGDLAGRRLLVAPDLPSWPSAEMLSNSVVQVLVGADGRPISATLLKPPGSASTEADQYALRAVSKVRFEPISSADPLNPLAAIALGQILFEWQTIPLPATNSTPDTTPLK
jgi:hypothetical protein